MHRRRSGALDLDLSWRIFIAQCRCRFVTVVRAISPQSWYRSPATIKNPSESWTLRAFASLTLPSALPKPTVEPTAYRRFAPWWTVVCRPLTYSNLPCSGG